MKSIEEHNEQQAELISKFAEEAVQEIQDNVSKHANELDANSLDSSSVTVSKKFTEMLRMVMPMTPLVEKGIVRVQEVDEQTDKAVFAIQLQQDYTWTTVDARGSETTSLAAGSGSYQSYVAPTYKEVQPVTKSATLQIHDNIRLVNPVRMAEIMAQSMEQVEYGKEDDTYTTLQTTASYTASVSIKMAGGYTSLPSGSYVSSGSTLTPSDLAAAKKDLRTTSGRKIVPDVTVVATEQYYDLKNSSDFSPGQSDNAYSKSATFDENGELVKFDGMDIVVSDNISQQSTGYFASSNGHWAFVGKKGMMVGRGQNSSQNKAQTWRDPKTHTTELTLDVNYKNEILYSKVIRAIACSDT